MQRSDFTVGTRVRLSKPIGGSYPGAMYSIAPGPVGTVIAVNHDADKKDWDSFAKIKFDQRIEDLDQWENVLHVNDDWDATPDDFEVVP